MSIGVIICGQPVTTNQGIQVRHVGGVADHIVKTLVFFHDHEYMIELRDSPIRSSCSGCAITDPRQYREDCSAKRQNRASHEKPSTSSPRIWCSPSPCVRRYLQGPVGRLLPWCPRNYDQGREYH